MSKLIKGVHHVALKCEDYDMFEEAKKFYHEVLGLEFVRTWGEGEKAGAMLDAGGVIIEIFASGMESPRIGTVNHFALTTDCVDDCVAAVRAAGYTITIEPNDLTIPSVPAFPIRMAFCIGPVGEKIEFFTEK